MALALSIPACSRDAVLLTDLSVSEAFAIQHVLAQASVPSLANTSKGGRVNLSVPRDRQDMARKILLEQGLPRPEFQSFGDVFANDGMLTSPFEERARYLYASSQGLENTLRNIEGVVFAKVHIVMPETRTLGRESVPASASVFLKYRPPSPVATMHSALQRLVANAIPGLAPERVVIVVSAVDAMSAWGNDNTLIDAAPALQGPGLWAASGWGRSLSHFCAAIAGGVLMGLFLRWRRNRAMRLPLDDDSGMPETAGAVIWKRIGAKLQAMGQGVGNRPP